MSGKRSGLPWAAAFTAIPPSGVASGYVWFDVMALLLAPRVLALTVRTWPLRRRLLPGTGRV